MAMTTITEPNTEEEKEFFTFQIENFNNNGEIIDELLKRVIGKIRFETVGLGKSDLIDLGNYYLNQVDGSGCRKWNLIFEN